MTAGRKLIVARDVQRAHDEGRTLTVDAHAIITPAARDLADELNVPLRPAPPAEPALATVAIGADHGGVTLKNDLAAWLRDLGHPVTDVGTQGSESVDYPVFAARVAEAVAAGDAAIGIIVDGAGIGSAMVANKIPGVRAAMCYDTTTAANAREHNHANVLTLGGSLIGPRPAREIVKTFLATPYGGDRHARRVALIDALDRK